MAATDYSPSAQEQFQWGVRRRNATQQLGNSLAQTNFTRGNYKANQAAEMLQLGNQFKQARNRLPGQYIARGMYGSGIYGQGLQDFNTQRTQAYGDMQRKYQQMLGQLNINDANANQQYSNQMSDVGQQEAMRRAALAAQLRSIQ